MQDETNLNAREVGVLAVVRRVLDGLPAGHGLEARFEPECDLSVVPVVTLRSIADGRRHTVHAMVYDTGVYTPVVGVGRAYFSTTDIGDGFSVILHDDIEHGPNHKDASPAFEAEFAAVLAEHIDAFDPVFPPGVGGHPLTEEMVAAARVVVGDHNASCAAGEELSLALNANGRTKKCDDVVAFVRADGTTLPLVVQTGVGNVRVFDEATGEVCAVVQVHRRDRLAILPEVIAANMQDLPSLSGPSI